MAVLLLVSALLVSRATVGGGLTGLPLLVGSVALAALWGALAWWSGLGVAWGVSSRRTWVVGLVIGAACAVAFCVGAWCFTRWGWLTDEIGALSHRAELTSAWLTWAVAVLAGFAEECVFRGTVFSWCRRAPVALSTLAYAAATCATGVFALVLAAVALGVMAAWARRLTDGLLAPVLVHGIWTSSMIIVLPLVT